MQLEVIGKPYQHSKEKGKIIVSQTKKLGPGNKRMIQFSRGMEPPQWTIGFESWDQKGYVFKDPANKQWVFFKRDMEYPIYKRPLACTYSDGRPRKRSFKEALEEGMMCERELVRVLRPLLKPLFVYSLPMSGAHCGGTDVIVTDHEEEDLDGGRDLVRRSRCSITCVCHHSTNKTGGHISYNTPIKEWYLRCKDDGVKAVISWVVDRYTDHEVYWFCPVTDENVNVFNKQSIVIHKIAKWVIPLVKVDTLV